MVVSTNTKHYMLIKKADKSNISLANSFTTPPVIGGVGEMKSNNGTQYFQQDRVYDSRYIAMCHPANIPGGSYRYLVIEDD